MKISTCSITDLMNPKFCTLDEAVTYAESVNNEAVWLTVIKRTDMPIEKAFQIASVFGLGSTWRVIVSDIRLPLNDAVETVSRVGKELWPSVLRRSDVNFNYAFYVAMSYFCEAEIWKIVLLEKGLNPNQAVKHAIEVKRYDVWNLLLEDEKIVDYFTKMSYVELLEVAEKTDYFYFWEFLMKRKNTEPAQIIYCAKRSSYTESWPWALKQKSVTLYLESLHIEDLIILAKTMDSPRLWETILLIRPEMGASLSFLYLKEAHDEKVWETVLSRRNVVAYIRKLKPEAALTLAHKINHFRIWRIISEKTNLKKYLLKLNWDEALDVALNTDSPQIKSMVLARLDIAIADIAEFASHLLNNKEWNTVSNRPDFIGYLQSLNDVEAIAFAALSGNTDIWIEVLSRVSIVPPDAIACAKQSNIENVWEVVRHRKDVIEFLKE